MNDLELICFRIHINTLQSTDIIKNLQPFFVLQGQISAEQITLSSSSSKLLLSVPAPSQREHNQHTCGIKRKATSLLQ